MRRIVTTAVVAIALGTLAGSMIGRSIGQSLDNADKAAAMLATYRSLEHGRTGQAMPWHNPNSGHSGTVISKMPTKNAAGQYCREYVQSATIGSETQSVYGRACRRPDGTWQMVR